ncbi:lysine 2,3-aminomutase [Deferribacterales bacterium RsTz2092]
MNMGQMVQTAQPHQLSHPMMHIPIPPMGQMSEMQRETYSEQMSDFDGAEPPSRHRNRAAFRRRYYPNATAYEWNDWKWQLANRITDVNELSKMLILSDSERMILTNHREQFPFAITPYYASLLDPIDDTDPLRLCVVPRDSELLSDGEFADPLGETHDEVAPGLVHRYPDRVLFLATNYCSTYCRYCTRSRVVGQRECSHSRWAQALDYIKAHREIRDVLVSGGDPLTMPDDVLDGLLAQIRAIKHVEIIRIGTKVPTVLPQRVTPSLVKVLKKYHPLYVSVHATHADEFTEESIKACERLANAGIPLGSQTVLLRGVNDDPFIMKKLMHRLMVSRVRPYYLYQCDPVVGTRHFRTSVAKGVEIISNLRGWTTGYAVPTFVIDAPGGGGKIPINVNNICGEDNGDLLIMNYEGKIFRYPQADKASYSQCV